ncbi:MAG: lipid-binding SYLF domain-containing protein [Acidobacteria bacterium]|nr:lipid-binding SYLF domain-containing protein [Acidobacteriota bacterium]
MKKFAVCTMLFGLCCLTMAEEKSNVDQRLDKAASVLQEITAAPDKGIPEDVLNSAKCVAIVPHMVKAGLGIGGEHGKGVATCKTSQGWSSPAFFTVSGGSFGFQIGAEGVDLVMLMMNDQGMQALLSDKFQVGGDASAAAGPVGRDAQAGTDWKLKAPILTYSRSKGVFGGISLNGTVIHQDKDATTAFYGQDMTSPQVLGGNVPAPPDARPFLNAVARAQTVAQR